MFALISPHEPAAGGYRVAEISQRTFEVAQPLFWKRCKNDAVRDECFYDPKTETIVDIPQPAPKTKPVDHGDFIVG